MHPLMIRLLTTIARNTFVESLRQPIFFILILAGIIAQIFNVLLSTYSLGFSEETEVSADNKILLDMGLATVMVIGMLLAAFVATAVVSREIEDKTALTVVSKPVSRPAFILGKFFGVAGAILVGVVILTVYLLFGIKHEVMSTARDQVGLVVLLFGGLGVLLPIVIGVWGNFFFGWVFSSTAIFTMLPASVIGYAISLGIDKEWALQPIGTDFKPQIMLAALCVMMSLMVLTALAVAVSTRLGQVMTILVCSGVFLLGLLSNHLLGRHAFDNEIIASVTSVEEPFPGFDLSDATSELTFTLSGPPSRAIEPGMSVYYGADPSGIGLAVPAHKPFEGDASTDSNVRRPPHPSLFVKSIDALNVTIVNAGGLRIDRLPQQGDWIFIGPTDVDWPVRVAWSVLPNFQYFWLVDAITQGHPIPPKYVGLVAGYSLLHITGLMALGVALFQTRDVG